MSSMLVPERASNVEWQISLARYIFASTFAKSKVVADIACGSGYGSFFLANKGAKEVIGGEISEEVTRFASSRYRKENLCFVRLDVTNIPFRSDSIDTIISFETIEHLRDWGKFLEECNRCLKLGGILIISTPNFGAYLFPWRNPWNSDHTREFNSFEFQQIVEKHFTIQDIYAQHIMSFTYKIKLHLPIHFSHFLSLLPGGNKLRRLLRPRLGPLLARILFGEVSDVNPFNASIDERFRIVPYRNEFHKKASHILLIARKG